MEKKDIKELEELLEGFKLLAVAGGLVMKDGKVDFSDAGTLVMLAPKFEILVKAFEGLSEVKEEIKDLKQDEVIKIISKLYEVVDAFEEAKK